MRKVLKFIGYIIGGIIVLLLCVVVWLNTPPGKNFVRVKAVAFLRNKLKTEVYIGDLGYGLPKYIVLKDVLFKDQKKDTLLAAGELKIDLDMLKLLHKQVDVQQILLTGVHAHIYRNAPDTNFNFSYIINAFTGSKPAKPKKTGDTASSLTINLDKIQFDDIHIRFDDHTGGMLLGLDLQHLMLKMKKVDIQHMLFHVKDLEIAGLQTTCTQDTSLLPSKPDTSTQQAKLQLIADNINLKQINVQYNNNLNKFLFGLHLANFVTQLNLFDLNEQIVDIKDFNLDTTAVRIVMGRHATPPAPVDTVVKANTTAGWRVNARDINLAAVNFKMDDENKPQQPSGMDYSHLDIKNLGLAAQDLLYTSDTISGNVKHATLQEQSGFDLRELHTLFTYSQQGAILRNLYLATSNTILQDYLAVKYPSLDALKARMQLLQINVELKKSIIGLKDVLVFAPFLEKQALFRKYKNGHLQLEATIKGFLNNLDVAHFYLAGMNNTQILLNGRLDGLPDANALNYNLHMAKLISSRDDISALLPPAALAQVRLPDKFGISGQVAGTTKDYNTNLLMISSDGTAYLKGYVFMSQGKGRERYDLFVNTTRLNLGHMLKQDSLMGPVTASFKVRGQSFDVKTMNVALNGAITSAWLKGYTYHDIKLNGEVAGKTGNINLVSLDTNIHIALKAKADFSGKYAAIKAKVQIDSIDLQALKLYSSELRARGTIMINFPVLNPDYPQGTFVWNRPAIDANGSRYFLDSIYIAANSSPEKGQQINANLNVMQAVITGHTPLTKLGGIIQEHINRHYAELGMDSTLKKAKAVAAQKVKNATDTAIPSTYDLNLVAHVENRPLLHSILPGLTSFDSISINGQLTPGSMLLDISVPQVVYGTTNVQHAAASVKETDSALTYRVTADEITAGSMKFWYPNINGNIDNGNINASISTDDSVKKQRFAVSAVIQKYSDSQVIKLNPGLVLNYETWQVSQPNKIVLAKDGFYVQNFNIVDKSQYININSSQPHPGSPLTAAIGNFFLSDITQMISSDTLLANGLLNGKIQVNSMNPPQINAALKIQDLSLMGDTIGDVTAEADNKQANAYTTKVNIDGRGNNVALTGTYYTQPVNGDNFNFDLLVTALQLKSIEGLAMGQIKNSSGQLNGSIHLHGSAASPQIKGEITTSQVATTISTLNAYFRMPSDKIEFTNTGLAFNNFTILDSAGNKAEINGTVNTQNLKNIALNLRIKAKDWRALHSSEKDNKVFYGDLLLSTNLDVKGTPSAPDVSGNIAILKGTKVTVAMPEKNPELESSQGVVEFVDISDSSRYKLLMPKTKDTTKVMLAAGSNVNVNIQIDRQASLSLIIDQASGDFLSVRGDASLNASITPDGSLGLTGIYNLHEGAYQLNYNFIKRKFTIQDGSSISFAGDPMKSQANITAIYEADVPPYDLVQKEVTDPSTLNYYKQQLPFNVQLHLRGPVLQPEISFNIVLPENKVYPISYDAVELIQGKLNLVRQDTSELNKQVFALLILNHFVGEDPFSSGAGSGGAAFIAKQSVSRFIGEQLNQFANHLVKGVDLSVDLASSEDYTTGDMRERTDLNLAASKRLLNDRLKVTVGNDFELEGPQTSNSDQNNLVPSNLAIDYNLSPDGRYVMRAYRKEYNAGVLEGYVTETGLNFLVSLDYNKFKYVFRKTKPAAPLLKQDTVK